MDGSGAGGSCFGVEPVKASAKDRRSFLSLRSLCLALTPGSTLSLVLL